MREVQINRNLKLREDGKLINVKTGEEFIPKSKRGGKNGCYLCVRKNHKNYAVHQLVMNFFGPPKPGPEYIIDHINRDYLDNRIENLRWATLKENSNNRKDNLPIGLRQGDFETLREYERKKARYYSKKRGG